MADRTRSRREFVLAMRDDLAQFATASTADNERLRQHRLGGLLDHVCTQSRFWSDRLADYRPTIDRPADEILQSLPTMTRADLQSHGRDMRILLPGTEPSDHALFVTSGSTGEPRRIVRHRETAARLADALTLLEWQWFDRDVTSLIGEFRVHHDDADDIPAHPPLTYIGSTARHSKRSSTHRTPAELLDELAALSPRYLFCNGLMMRLMAAEQLRQPRPVQNLDQIMSVSDRVDPSTRILVREAFGARVCDRYSSEEFGIIALECPADEHMHLIAPRFLFEVVDDNDAPCAPGEPGRVLITSLVEHVQPFIRYDIGDVAVLGGECPAGISWPIVAEIRGRTRQMIRRDDGSTVLTTLIGSSLLSMRALLDFHIVRYRNAFVVEVHTAKPLDPADRGEIEHEVRRLFREDRPVHVLERSDGLDRRNWKRQEFDDVDEEYDASD